MHYRQCDAQYQGARLSLGMMVCELGSQLSKTLLTFGNL